jgi:DNA processing protein
MVEDRQFWLAWSQINGIGPILLRRLQKHFGTLADAWDAHPEDLLNIDGFGEQTVAAIATARSQIQPKELLSQHEQANPSFLTPADAEYPALLLETSDYPPVLYCHSTLPPSTLIAATPMVAIVGTRSPSTYGKDSTRQVSAALTRHGFTVVSGLAAGIDTEAHRSCLDAGGRTIAVLGCGVDVVYPHSNRGLYQDIVQSGLVLSEHPAGTQPDRTHFPRRNRIIAGLCRAILVMEAPERSGGLITAHYANEYGRDVYALPGRIDNPKAIGCLKLIRQGAEIIAGIDDLLELLGEIPALQPTVAVQPSLLQPSLLLNLDPPLAQVLQVLTELDTSNPGDSAPFDFLITATRLPASTVSSALLQLELEGLITQLPGMRYQRSS